MRKRLLRKAGAICLAASMALTPASQSVMAEEVYQEESSSTEAFFSEESSAEETMANADDSFEAESAVNETEKTETNTQNELTETEISTETDTSIETETSTETETQTAENVTAEAETQKEAANYASPVYEGEGYQYTIEDGKALLSKYTGTNKNVVIPSTLNGYPVTKLTSDVFMNSSIESVVIPSSITEYELTGLNMFVNCNSLKSVKIESSASLVANMFDRCTSIETIEITGNPSIIGSYAFQGTKIKKLQIPSSVIKIDQSAFAYSGIEEITIPASVKEIESCAFESCTALKNVLYESSANIAIRMFENCSNLENVSITGNVTSIGAYAFSNSGLRKFEISPSVTYLESHSFSRSKLENITIPATVKVYGTSVFFECENLTTVRIESDADISEEMFSRCNQLSKLEITGKPTVIRLRAFYQTQLGEDTVIPDSVTTIEDGNPFKKLDSSNTQDGFLYEVTDNEAVIVGYDGKETDVTIPSELGGYPVTKVKSMNGGENIINLVIPKTITGYAEEAFTACLSLVSVKIESSADIPAYLFAGCNMIEQVEFTGQPSSIGDAAFYGADLWDVVIPDSVANIGAAAFTRYDESGNYLYTVENGEAVLLDYFGTQTDVVLPATIDDYALTTIGRMNVYSYQNIERLTIPASIRAYWYTEFGVFASCENLKYVKIENSADIADSMFYDCKSLESVEITGKPTRIGSSAFEQTALKKFDIPASVTTLDTAAFALCDLESIVIPSTVQNLGVIAFSSCNKLTSVTIGCKNCDNLGLAFSGCSNLKRIEFGSTVETINMSGLDSSMHGNLYGKGITLYVTEDTPAVEYVKECTKWGFSYVILSKNQTGLINVGNNVWHYKINGVIQQNYTGLVKHAGSWYYVKNGVLDWNYTGLTKYYGTWYHVQKGYLNWNYTGLTNYYGTWYYVKNGVLDWTYTGLAKNNGGWYYVKRGILDWTYTGLTKYYGTWYCVQKGFLNWNYTGMTNYYGKWYYIKNGVLNWDYKGYFTQDGVRYYVKNGVGTVQ